MEFQDGITSADANFQYRGGEWRAKPDDDPSWSIWRERVPDTVRVTVNAYYLDEETGEKENYHLSIDMADTPTHKINFIANDGGESERDGVVMPSLWSGSTQSVTLPKCRYERTGYHFIGWWVGDDNPPAYNPADADAIRRADAWETGEQPCLIKSGGLLSSREEMNVYAMWEANAYYVEFDLNGGFGSVDALEMTYGESQMLPDVIDITAPENAKFGGWNTSIDGTGKSYQPGDEIKNLTAENGATVTLYARWKYSLTLKLWSYLNGELTDMNISNEFSVYEDTTTLNGNDDYDNFIERLNAVGVENHSERLFLTLDGWYDGRTRKRFWSRTVK